MAENDLIALAERCEEATGATRELDAMIHWAINDGVAVGYAAYAPAYTASLDAAMTLVPEGAAWSIGCEDDAQTDWLADLTCFSEDPDDYSLYIRAATPAVALCAAALRARAAISTTNR